MCAFSDFSTCSVDDLFIPSLIYTQVVSGGVWGGGRHSLLSAFRAVPEPRHPETERSGRSRKDGGTDSISLETVPKHLSTGAV